MGTTNLVETLTQSGTATNWKQIAPSDFFNIGLKLDGTIWGWGQNDYFQVGDGTLTNRYSPVQIGTATDWKMVATSQTRSGFALKNNGTLWGWGSNGAGLLGDSTVQTRNVPTQLNADTDWKTISLGTAHILALKNNGTLWAWGTGTYGECGDNLPLSYYRDTPQQVGTDSDWKIIATGRNMSFGIKTNGTLWAWGKNNLGQLGDGTTVNKSHPVQIGTETNWAAVAPGLEHVVALKTNGEVVTWGANYFGQLGNGTTTGTITPAAITITGCVLDNAVFGKENDGVVLAPNPTTGKVFLDGVGVYQSVGVYNCLGQEVLSLDCARDDKTVTLDLSDYPSGVYLVKIANGDGVIEKRVLKQ
jgi:alpha-tubulin suppressor-like RCC1 family protein